MTTIQEEIETLTEGETLAGFPVRGISLEGTIQIKMMKHVGDVANGDTIKEIASRMHKQNWWRIIKWGMGHLVSRRVHMNFQV